MTSSASSSSSSLYGFFSAYFGSNSEGEGDEDHEDNEDEDHDNENGDHENHHDEDENAENGHDILEMSAESVELARQQFEEMMSMPNDNQEPQSKTKTIHSSNSGGSSSSSSNSNSRTKDAEERNIIATRTINKAVLSNRNSPPPLTAILRERRLKEIQLLSTLHNSDDAVNELWALWIAERGPTAAANLLHAEELMSVESWTEAEQLLLTLIDTHGIHWAEPVNRLATLYYMQGRVEESKALCELVLETKPWHFGALSGIVLVCTAMNDAVGARMWAARRLPPVIGGPSVSGGERRNTWTERAVDDAEESLRRASLVGRSKSIGVEEVEFRTFRAKLEEDVQRLGGEADVGFGEENVNGSASSPSSSSSFSEDAWQ